MSHVWPFSSHIYTHTHSKKSFEMVFSQVLVTVTFYQKSNHAQRVSNRSHSKHIIHLHTTQREREKREETHNHICRIVHYRMYVWMPKRIERNWNDIEWWFNAVNECICRHSSWLGVITSCFSNNKQQLQHNRQTSIYFIWIFRAVDFAVEFLARSGRSTVLVGLIFVPDNPSTKTCTVIVAYAIILLLLVLVRVTHTQTQNGSGRNTEK